LEKGFVKHNLILVQDVTQMTETQTDIVYSKYLQCIRYNGLENIIYSSLFEDRDQQNTKMNVMQNDQEIEDNLFLTMKNTIIQAINENTFHKLQ